MMVAASDTGAHTSPLSLACSAEVLHSGKLGGEHRTSEGVIPAL